MPAGAGGGPAPRAGRVYLTCGEDNAPSWHTMEHLGAELLEICAVPGEYVFGRQDARHRIYQRKI